MLKYKYLESDIFYSCSDGTYNSLYLFYNKHTQLYKIGITKNINQRIRQLITSSGCIMDIIINLNCYEEIDVEPILLEKLCHNYFLKQRIIGEWFNLSIRDLVDFRAFVYSVEAEVREDYLKSHLLSLNKICN